LSAARSLSQLFTSRSKYEATEEEEDENSRGDWRKNALFRALEDVEIGREKDEKPLLTRYTLLIQLFFSAPSS